MVRIYIEIDKQEVNLILQNILYISEFHSNLISILRICSQELGIIFRLNMVTAWFLDEGMVIKGIWRNRLYLVNILKIPQVFLAHFLQKPAQINVQNCCFDYIEVDVIRSIVRKRLVNGLDIVRTHSMECTYKNCIFPKIHNLSYNEETTYKTKVLEYIHVGLWNPLSVILIDRSHYFILLIDKTSLFQTVEFLVKKMVENMLEVLKTFITESKRQTGQKLMQIKIYCR